MHLSLALIPNKYSYTIMGLVRKTTSHTKYPMSPPPTVIKMLVRVLCNFIYICYLLYVDGGLGKFHSSDESQL